MEEKFRKSFRGKHPYYRPNSAEPTAQSAVPGVSPGARITNSALALNVHPDNAMLYSSVA